MIVLGDVSGIQRYVFDVPEAGGGQARRLRARSFLVQALAECAARRVADAMGWPSDGVHRPFAAAGKFLLRGDGDAKRVGLLTREMNAELLAQTNGELRLSLAAGDGGTEVAAYRDAQQALQRQKTSPWQPHQDWNPAELVLREIGHPCELCRRERAETTETDDEGVERRVCRACREAFDLGRELPNARSVAYRPGNAGRRGWFGYGIELSPQPASEGSSQDVVAGIPRDARGRPRWFLDLAQDATGDKLLAVLKADVDSLGRRIEELLDGRDTLAEHFAFAKRLDAFFSGRLQGMIAGRPIYSVFAGGDDLLMVGPWDVVLAFAGEMREAFRAEFPGLTISAGLAVFKPKRPVKTAVAQAERLLEAAKGGTKDQCAALGQVWPWRDHPGILAEARKLAGWAAANLIQRGWLHTVLELAEARHGRKPDPLATARLAYHVGRNWPKVGTEPRRWADDLIARFDEANDPKVRYLPAVLRHALTATRRPGDRE